MEDRKITPELMVKKYKTKKDITLLKEYIKTVDPDVIDIKRRLSKTQSDILASIIGNIKDGYSPVIVFCGRQQKGKTRGACSLANVLSCWLYYKYITIDDFFLKPIDLLKGINDDGYQILILDESGASGSGINKYEWWSQLNKLFDYIYQTQAILRNIYILCLPFVPDLTTDIRKYIDYTFTAKSLNKRIGRSEFRVDIVVKEYRKLVRSMKDNKQVFIEILKIWDWYIPDKIWYPIEKMTNEFKTGSRKERIREMLKKDDWLIG